MTQLSRADRFFRWQARHIERRTLHFLASQRLLRAIFALTAPLGASMPKGMTPVEDETGALWFHPPELGADAPLLMYLHGGGFTIGSPRTHAALVAHLARAAGMRAVAVPYRLAPEHPFPAARDDAIAGFDRLVSDGTPPAAIGGDSAGGCLALQVAQHTRDTKGPQLKALVLIAPVADLSDDMEGRFAAAKEEILIPPAWTRRLLASYLPGVDTARPDVSPLLADLSNLPPTLIQASAEEALAQDARRLSKAMDDVTLDLWSGLPHVWHLHAGYAPAADKAVQKLGAFLKEHVA